MIAAVASMFAFAPLLSVSLGNFWSSAVFVPIIGSSGYVEIEKEFRGKKPCTMLRLSEKGRAAFRRYRADMQKTLGELER
jgi:hypothetical protein